MTHLQEIAQTYKTLTAKREEVASKMQNNPEVLYSGGPSEGYVQLACRSCGEMFEVNFDMYSDYCFYCLTEPEVANSPVWDMDKQEQNKLIREGLKRLAPGLSVTSGKGTASFWVNVRGTGEYGSLNQAEKAVMQSLGTYGTISPDEREMVIFKLYPKLGNAADLKKATRYARNAYERLD